MEHTAAKRARTSCSVPERYPDSKSQEEDAVLLHENGRAKQHAGYNVMKLLILLESMEQNEQSRYRCKHHEVGCMGEYTQDPAIQGQDAECRRRHGGGHRIVQ